MEDTRVYICDLLPELDEHELRQVLDAYGRVVSFERLGVAPEQTAAIVEYATPEAAEEARSILNHALLRGRTCRCFSVTALEAIRQTMDTGQRLVVGGLDPVIESRGLWDVSSLFGQVLDCRVEEGEDGRSRGFGFAHFSREEEAAKMVTFMDGMQIGESVVEVRPFELKDAALFLDCRYDASAAAPGADPEPHSEEEEMGEEGEEGCGGEEAGEQEKQDEQATDLFRSLGYHHIEVLADEDAKVHCLKRLMQLYGPSQDQQMVVIVGPAQRNAVMDLLGECCEPVDVEAVDANTTEEACRMAIEGFETGNIFVLVLSGDVAVSEVVVPCRPCSVLINFDLPGSLQQYLLRILRRSDSGTRVHSFFSPQDDGRLAVPLMAAMEEAGHEIVPELVEFLE